MQLKLSSRAARRPRAAFGRGACVGLLAISMTAAATGHAWADEPKSQEGSVESGAQTKPASKFKSPEDGWLDISGFLDTAYGFVPLLIPITEPAVGYGAAAALVFMDRPHGEARPGLDRPNITAVGVLGTDNGTRGAMAGDVRHWGENRVQSVVGLVDASINLDFYGIGENSELSEHPLTYNLDTLGGGLRGKYRFGKSFLWLGATYVLADMEARFDEAPPSAELQELEGDTHVGGLVPLLAYDSRDNLFTPTRGTYAEGSAGFFDEALGGDDSFQRVSLQILHYIPLPAKVTLGFQGKATFAFGDTPFYLLPYITLRGVPIFRYQGEDAADLEVEARWQFWKRFSLVGFAGAGMAWNDFEHVDDQVTAFAGGTGLRYEIARKYGLQVGADVAFGPEGAVLYIVFGSAWARP